MILSGTSTVKACIAILLAFGLSACGEYREPKVEANIYPPDYKSKLLDILRDQLDDPTNIRDAFIAEPALKTEAGANRYVVCVRFNSKNKTGQYEGSRDFAAFYYAGDFTQLVRASRELCGNAAYQSFPELQKLCRSLDCKT